MNYTNISAMLPMLCWFLGETARAKHHIRSTQHLFGQHVKKTMEQKESNSNVPCVHIAVCARLEDIGLTARPVVRCYLFIYQVKTLYDVWHPGTGCCDDQCIFPPDWLRRWNSPKPVFISDGTYLLIPCCCWTTHHLQANWAQSWFHFDNQIHCTTAHFTKLQFATVIPFLTFFFCLSWIFQRWCRTSCYSDAKS